MKIKSFQELFEMDLRYAYDCEQKLVKKAIPSMIEASRSPELRRALEQHLEETRTHVTRLDQVFRICGAEPKTEGNDVVDEMKDAAEDVISATEDAPSLRDAGLIACGNQVEHYEIAVYGTLESYARQLGLTEAASLLQQTLNEEKAADAKLTQIGETVVNPRATQERRAA